MPVACIVMGRHPKPFTNPDFLLGGSTSASAEYWSGRAMGQSVSHLARRIMSASRVNLRCLRRGLRGFGHLHLGCGAGLDNHIAGREPALNDARDAVDALLRDRRLRLAQRLGRNVGADGAAAVGDADVTADARTPRNDTGVAGDRGPRTGGGTGGLCCGAGLRPWPLDLPGAVVREGVATGFSASGNELAAISAVGMATLSSGAGTFFSAKPPGATR